MNQDIIGKVIVIRGFELEKALNGFYYDEVKSYLETCELVEDRGNSNDLIEYYRAEKFDYSSFFTITSRIYFNVNSIVFNQNIERTSSEK